jgi:hypothetical protein
MMVEISLRGLFEVVSDLFSGVFEEISLAFTEGEVEDWDTYDIAPSP